MTNALYFQCSDHKDKFECPDTLISYNEKFDEYGLIIHDGGESASTIRYCPYCGQQLPESKRVLWFETLEGMGFDDPVEQEIPPEFHSGAWYRG